MSDNLKMTPKPVAKTGRKSKLPDYGNAVLEYLRVGHTDKDACTLAGVNPDTFYSWLKEFPEFSEAVKKARLESKDVHVKLIQKAAKKSWMAAAWFLERKFKDEFSTKQYMTHDGTITNLTDTAAKTAAKYKKPTTGKI